MTATSQPAGEAAGRSSRGLHWESFGAGEPVLLIMGLGLSGRAWWRTVPVLAQRLRVITFDNRGIARSRGSTYSYTTEAMADDAVSVLDAAGVADAHVYGYSLGGMAAQQLALRHRGRVRSLVLGATHGGGPRAVRADPEVRAFFRRRAAMGVEQGARAAIEYTYAPRTQREHPDRIAEDLERRLGEPFSRRAYQAQLWAGALHNCHRRLGRIAVPTLVVHGAQDRIVPVANGEMLASRIPGADLLRLEDAGHVYATDEPSVDAEIARFLGGQRA